MHKMFFFGCFLVVSVLVGSVVSQASARITNLPGLASQPSFAQYAGYVTVDENAGRTLFYWFTESQSKPASDPVVLWLTGGPGCSSLIAFLSENGPFVPNPDGKTLSLNPYSWNKIANVIWLESPSGVGFSYSNTSSDRNVGDVRTADDTYTFLLKFFQLYPQFAGREFWVTGESYGGHYVPEAVDRILQGNQQGNPKINVKGFMAGNPWTYMPIDNLGAVNTWWSRALIPKSASDLIIQSCNLSDVGPLLTKNSNYEWKLTANCDDAIYNAQSLFSGVDIYDIYIDVCNGLRDEVILNELVKHGAKLHSHLLSKKSKKDQNLDPCIDTHLTAYLNRLDVQTALHARPRQWSECGGVDYSYADVQKSVIPVYQSFFNNHPELQILVYSGDVDAIVPYWGTKLWVDGFNRTVKAPWRAWYDSEQQVGGFVEVYDTFTFTTVRNAGHMVPWYQPERGYIMYSSFLTKGALP